MRKWAWLLALLPCFGLSQLRVATWNISNYGGGRISDIQTVVFSEFQGRSMAPDILVTQEILSAGAQSTLLSALNSAPGSSGTWAAAPFTDGNDTDNAFFYRSDRVQLIASTIIGVGGSSPRPPRDTKRYDVRLLGYTVLQPKLALYSAHMKAGNTAEDQARKLAEASLIRTNAQGLSGFDGFMVVGDFNLYSSTEDAYQKLVGSEANNTGRVFDPIATIGSWDSQAGFRFVHTQDPATTAGMDSRFDFLLLCQNLVDGQGFDYMGNPSLPYSTLMWNDPAHSYRAWGNDGTSFNQMLTVNGNTMVGPAIAQAIRNAATTAGGHVPVFLDLKVPAETAVSPSSIDFGTVVAGNSSTRTIQVSNATNSDVWGLGIADLVYQLSATPGFGVPSGTFVRSGGPGANAHTVSLDTGQPGDFSGTVTVAPSSPDGNSAQVQVTGRVVPDELFASGFQVEQGTLLSGGLVELAASDNQYLKVDVEFFSRSSVAAGIVNFESICPVSSSNDIRVRFEAGATFLVQQKLEAYDFTQNAWVLLNDRTMTKGDHAFEVAVPNSSAFLEPATKRLRLRARLFPGVAIPDGSRFEYRVDKVAWVIR